MLVRENSLKYQAETMKALAIILATPLGLILLNMLLGHKGLAYLARLETLIAFCVTLVPNHALQHGYGLMQDLDREKYARSN